MNTSIYNDYELVVGLEIHTQLSTQSKAFSREYYEYGAHPNTQTSPQSLAHPGTLPRFNKTALDLAIRMGLACGSEILKTSFFARKNYFYADLPKGYQITQYITPICVGGGIKIKLSDGTHKVISLDKIICEEDSGKSQHDLDPFSSLIDLNRAGVPLIEIVSNPDISQPEEAYQFLTEIRKMVRYLDICDGNMEEGSLRCDANVSVRKKGEKGFRQRVEIKNVNSIRNVQRAIAYEFKRQIDVYENGGGINMETLGFDAQKGETYMIRSKELANDYRYFSEPDLPPVHLTDEEIEAIKLAMPELPNDLLIRLVKDHGLTEYDAQIITADKETAELYQSITKLSTNYKGIVNIMNGPVRSYVNENSIEYSHLPITPQQIADLLQAIDNNIINFSVAQSKVFPELIKRGKSGVISDIITDFNLAQVSDNSVIFAIIDEVLALYPEKVAEYKSGKTGLLGMFMGEVMKRSKGKADPKVASKLVEERLGN
jgi:aspartyl-tRNA(Asn)/glutamyl-tRNA(Gln) amidotransferase subunit B